MNRAKPKPIEVKKTLVRNAEQPVPSTISVEPSTVSISSKLDIINSACSSKSTHSQNKVSSNKLTGKTRFNVPEIHSTLKMSKKVDEITKPRKTKSLSEVEKSKLSVTDKVSRKVNFPYDQPVFKDLIPLLDNEVKVQPPLVTRGPVFHKDKEPSLSNFVLKRKQKVYYHNPRNSSRFIEEKKKNIPTSTGLRLYKILQINKEC